MFANEYGYKTPLYFQMFNISVTTLCKKNTTITHTQLQLFTPNVYDLSSFKPH